MIIFVTCAYTYFTRTMFSTDIDFSFCFSLFNTETTTDRYRDIITHAYTCMRVVAEIAVVWDLFLRIEKCIRAWCGRRSVDSSRRRQIKHNIAELYCIVNRLVEKKNRKKKVEKKNTATTHALTCTVRLTYVMHRGNLYCGARGKVKSSTPWFVKTSG